jgi:hypothetical protein
VNKAEIPTATTKANDPTDTQATREPNDPTDTQEKDFSLAFSSVPVLSTPTKTVNANATSLPNKPPRSRDAKQMTPKKRAAEMNKNHDSSEDEVGNTSPVTTPSTLQKDSPTRAAKLLKKKEADKQEQLAKEAALEKKKKGKKGENKRTKEDKKINEKDKSEEKKKKIESGEEKSDEEEQSQVEVESSSFSAHEHDEDEDKDEEDSGSPQQLKKNSGKRGRSPRKQPAQKKRK